MLPLIEKLILFLALMMVGYVGARRGVFGADFARSASKLTLDVFMTATILYSVVNNPPALSGRELAWALLVSFLTLLLSYAVSALLTRLLPVKKERKPIFELLVSVMNPMFIGIPVAEILLGPAGVLYIALQNAFFNLLLFTYGVWRIKAGEGGALRLRDMISMPLIATVLGVLIFALRLPCPDFLKSMLGTVSPATMPMSMVVIGASLGRVRLIDALTEKSLYLVAVLRLILMPLLTWLMFRVLPAEPMLRGAMLIVSACPSGIIVSILCIQYGKDVEYSSKGILLDTALSMLTIPVLMSLLL